MKSERGRAIPGLQKGLEIVPDDEMTHLFKAGIPGLGRLRNLSPRTSFEIPPNAGWDSIMEPVTPQDRQGIVVSRRIRDGRAGGDHIQRIADDVGENQSKA